MSLFDLDEVAQAKRLSVIFRQLIIGTSSLVHCLTTLSVCGPTLSVLTRILSMWQLKFAVCDGFFS